HWAGGSIGQPVVPGSVPIPEPTKVLSCHFGYPPSLPIPFSLPSPSCFLLRPGSSPEVLAPGKNPQCLHTTGTGDGFLSVSESGVCSPAKPTAPSSSSHLPESSTCSGGCS
ncbi:unnamed protein product, partial [Coccothraustes coccothraustes]